MSVSSQISTDILAKHESCPCQNLACSSSLLASELEHSIRSIEYLERELKRVRSENKSMTRDSLSLMRQVKKLKKERNTK